MNTKKYPVPYELVSPGYEAVYTGEKSATPLHEDKWPITRLTDRQGNIYDQWSVWTWVPMNGEVDSPEERKAIDRLQAALGPLDDETRRIRAHIASLVLCNPGIPVTVDALLSAIGRGWMEEPSYHNGCWLDSPWWESQTTEPRGVECMQVIESSLEAYLAGEPLDAVVQRFPEASGFIQRAYTWLGLRQDFSEVQCLLVRRMLLPFDYFTKRRPEDEAGVEDCFGESGRGRQLDALIERLAGLPKIYANYTDEFRQRRDSIQDAEQRELYSICGALAHSLHGLSDCHHSMYRWIENWIYAIGTLKWQMAPRKRGTERERLSRLLFGYTLGLDSWLLGKTMQFLLLDLGYVDLGCDPRDEIARVYAYLGAEQNPVKTWLAACLWHNLSGGGNPAGLIIQQPLNEKAQSVGISTREWMDKLLKSCSY